jgi:hypothetical protein
MCSRLVFGKFSAQILIGIPLILTEVLYSFLQIANLQFLANSNIVPKLGHNHFFPNPFQFIIYCQELS